MSGQRLKILLVAHEFSPFSGSECAVGWNIATRLAAYHDVTVLFSSGSQFNPTSYVKSINQYFQTSPPINGLTLINIDLPKITKLLAWINSGFKSLSPIGLPILYYTGYKFWQKSVFKEAKRLHRRNNFDIAHQLTQISFREPGYLWKLGIPFFWGPTGGTSTFPKSFYRTLSFKSQILDRIRTLSARYQFNFTPRIKKANEYASIIYTFSKADEVVFRRRSNGLIKIMLDVGTSPQANNEFKANLNAHKLKGIWCGRLDEYKAPGILLKALARSRVTRENVIFQIIGTGSLEKGLIKLAEDLDLRNIEWINKVNHKEVFELMSQADFFVHTSIKEATSSVIPEALSSGLPVICHDAYGMSVAIDETCGIRIPLKSPEYSIEGFHKAIEQLVIDKNKLEEYKIGARKRSSQISWDKMAQTIAIDYLNTKQN